MTPNLHHTVVHVKDMDRALNLFQNILGFDQLWRMPQVGGKKLSAVLGQPGMQAEISYLQAKSGGTALELVRMQNTGAGEPEFASNGAGLSMMVDDIATIHQKLIADGWEPFTEPVKMLSPEGEEIKMFCFRTDGGLLVELFEKA